MRGIDLVKRWLTAAAVTLAPLLVLVLPPLLLPGADYANAEQQYRAYANDQFPWEGLWLQVAGAVLLVPAVQGIAGTVWRLRRGVALGLAGLLIGMIAAFSLLLLLGLELGQAFVLTEGSDTEAGVALALAMSRWPVFTALLGLGFAGFFVALPILALGLWRSRVVPMVVPALFLLPVLIGFAPLPAPAANLVPSFGLLAPCLWITVQLLRRPLLPPMSEAPARPAAGSEDDLSVSDASRS